MRARRICILAGAALAAWVAALPFASARQRVTFDGGFRAGEIVIRNTERRLYLVLGDGTALRYPVAVGKAGKRWTGRTVVDAKYHEVDWSPPASVRRDKPHLPDVIPAGARNNPMGARVLSLPGEYAIHGTSPSMRSSVGTFASYGCFRMLNEDIIDLFERVRVGTVVTVLP